ncbi:unnamed protein product [Moneuplotes crassus]|uniref:Uncharacterized protein n=1 Tax=Euplotes crassus TaxID=5936 RepID=A0AAD1XBC1_EUPCR|nr:unnamed protein product [Moneuplotes crassus]
MSVKSTPKADKASAGDQNGDSSITSPPRANHSAEISELKRIVKELQKRQDEEVSLLKKNLEQANDSLEKSNSELEKIRQVNTTCEDTKYEETKSEKHQSSQNSLCEDSEEEVETSLDNQSIDEEQCTEEAEFSRKWFEVMTNVLPQLPLVNNTTPNITFKEYIKDNSTFVSVAQTAFDIVYKYTESVVEDKMKDLLSVLGIKKESETYNHLLTTLDPFWRQNSQCVFDWKYHKLSLLRWYIHDFQIACERNLKIKVKLIEEEQFANLIRKLFDLAVSMCLHNPKITIILDRSLFSKEPTDSLKCLRFKERKYHSLDGTQEKKCIVVMPVPCYGTKPLKSMKPCVITYVKQTVEKQNFRELRALYPSTEVIHNVRSQMPQNTIETEIFPTLNQDFGIPKGFKTPVDEKQKASPVYGYFPQEPSKLEIKENIPYNNVLRNSYIHDSSVKRLSTEQRSHSDIGGTKSRSSSLRRPYSGNYKYQGYPSPSEKSYGDQKLKRRKLFSYLDI